jgi:hypothetical protein
VTCRSAFGHATLPKMDDEPPKRPTAQHTGLMLGLGLLLFAGLLLFGGIVVHLVTQ